MLKLMTKTEPMPDYWRPSFGPKYREKIEEFLERHNEIPFDDPKEFMQFATDQLIVQVETGDLKVQKEQERIKKQLEDSLDELGS